MSTPVFPGVTVTVNSGTLGQVLTIYRLSPAARAFDTPNLLSSRFENVTTALGAAFAALPIGTVLFEDTVNYTYDGANEDVEILTPGLYAIEASVQVERAGANPVVSVAVHKNGALLAAGVVSSHALTNTTGQTMLSCASAGSNRPCVLGQVAITPATDSSRAALKLSRSIVPRSFDLISTSS